MDEGPLCASLVPAAGQRKEVETGSAPEEGTGGRLASGPGRPAPSVSPPPATAVILSTRDSGQEGPCSPQRSTAETPLCSVAPSLRLVSLEPSGFSPGT